MDMIFRTSRHISPLIALIVTLGTLLTPTAAVKCLDCVGKNCMGDFCEGDYCVLSHYAPRWGTVEWGQPQVVKGCMSGTMLRKDVRSHCETADGNGDDVFTCFCNNKDYCNGDKAIDRLEVEPVQLVTCACDGPHCSGQTCLGELCSFVVNHRTKQTEQGCVNASVPILERRSAGACMVPPITGAMHHSVARTAEDLLVTESCVCGTDYCNLEKPRIAVPEKMKCQAFVKAEVMGTKMESRNVSCTGEYCFKVRIKSKIGHMSTSSTIGCASFIEGSELAEELNPVGCGKFTSEKVEVEGCFQTNDKRAIGRARASQQVVERARPKAGKTAGKLKAPKIKPKVEVEYEEEGKEEDEFPPEDENEGKDEPAKEEPNEEREEGRNERDSATTEQHYIFERPTLPPEPEDSNTALISVFLLLILLIILTGVVYKLELHKRLFRGSYDTVAGG
ncbi:Protein W05H12.1 [Aphelenchoides avenae]|nr:Protein W05H12.1 [Aphelenchus avenae]